jgi:5-methyltetrahydropteroyltriglutamate--homocysteine methyltransferase
MPDKLPRIGRATAEAGREAQGKKEHSMKRSTNRILTTHVGSLVRPPEVREVMRAKESGQYDAKEVAARVKDAVAAVVQKQAECGIDIPSDGEYTKSSFSGYANDRLSGFETRPAPTESRIFGRGRDRKAFAEFYQEYDATQGPGGVGAAVCVGPISYKNLDAVQGDIQNLQAALQGVQVEEAFIPAVAPGTMELQRKNEYYPTEEAYLFAIAEAMKTEYKAIVEAGFILQIDDPRLVTQYDTEDPEPRLEDYRKFAALRVEALNHALAGLPEDRIRYHVCWGSWHGPHTTDVGLKDIVDIVLSIRAGGYSLEAANGRHAHEWKVWETVKLPAGKVLIPGVIAHTTNLVEHPELVAQRLVQYAKLVGRENVIAGADCGFAQGAFLQRVHPSIMWAKLQTLAEGARLATRELWGR